jgi:hypothetical protein
MQTPTNRRSLGRLDRAVAALSAVAICDAMRIGFLRQSLKLSSAAGKQAAVNAKRFKVKSKNEPDVRLDANYSEKQ